MRTVVAFPGQGSQNGEMRAMAERWLPELVELAEEEAGVDVFEHAGESTRYVQPALYCASLAGWRALEEAGCVESRDLALTGHSLGELPALVAAEALTPEDGLRLVTLRGAVMADAARGSGRGGMLAVMGPGARQFVAAHGGAEVTLANDNAPEQVVAAGREETLDRLEALVREGGYRARRLPLEFAAHSRLMREASAGFARALRGFRFRTPRVPVWSCSTARPFEDIPRQLAEGISRPVLWRELVQRLHAQGARTFVETGPGHVLTKLIRRTVEGVDARTAASMVTEVERTERACLS